LERRLRGLREETVVIGAADAAAGFEHMMWDHSFGPLLS
jgi:hypothetical protein